jgi:hypothetical protein
MKTYGGVEVQLEIFVCIFIYGLFSDAVSRSDYIASNVKIINAWTKNNMERSGRVPFQVTLGIRLEGLRKPTRIIMRVCAIH